MSHSDNDLAWLNAVRDIEFNATLKYINQIKISDVLELGSGTGYIISKLKNLYTRIDGLEVLGSSYSQLEPSIKYYDGVHIPASFKTYDMIISFHVLEHATDLRKLMDDCKRVLKDDGLMVHILPSSTWRILTIIFWFFGGIAFLLRKINLPVSNSVKAKNKKGIDWWWRRLLPHRHGEIGNTLTEIFYFRKNRWIKEFQASGFNIIELESSEIVYWGNDFLRTTLSFEKRKVISKLIGASSIIYVMKKINESNVKLQII